MQDPGRELGQGGADAGEEVNPDHVEYAEWIRLLCVGYAIGWFARGYWERTKRHEAQVPNYRERHPRDERKPSKPLARRLVEWIYS